MAFKLPNAARLDSLSSLIATLLSFHAKVHLLKTRVIESDTVTLATLSAHEANFAGYAPALLSSWTTPTVSNGQPASAFGTATFTVSSSPDSGPIFGLFLTDNAGVLFFGMEDYGSVPVSVPTAEPYVVVLNYLLATM